MPPPSFRLSVRNTVLLGGLALLLVLAFSRSPLGARLEWGLSDLRLAYFASNGAAASVVVVVIDEAALDVLGPWPWPRTRMAEFIRRLGTEYRPSAIILDMVLPPGPPANEDARLAQTLARDELPPVVIGQLFLDDQTRKGYFQPGSVQLAGGEAVNYSGYLASAPPIVSAVSAVGHMNATVDEDGRVRRLKPLLCASDGCSLSLGLAYVSYLLGEPTWFLQRGEVGNSAWSLRPESGEAVAIPLAEDFTVSIPWRWPTPHLYVSAAEVWEGSLPKDLLENRIVMLGGHALGTADYIQTPLGLRVPGVEAHARILSAWLAGSFSFSPRYEPWLIAAVLAVQAALLLMLRNRRLAMLASALALNIAWLGTNILAYLASLELSPILPTLFPLVFASMLSGAMSRTWQRVLLRRFAVYLPDPLVARLSIGEEPVNEMAWTTVLYADIVGYTSVSRGMSPERVAYWGNTGVDLMIGQVESSGGHIDNVAGDGLLAYWRDGTPFWQADQALVAARAIRQGLSKLNRDLAAEGYPPLDIGMGLHAGPLMAGSYGHERRRYTVLGEVANLAHRIERYTRKGSDRLLFSAEVANLQRGFSIRKLGNFNLVESGAPTELYALNDMEASTSTKGWER